MATIDAYLEANGMEALDLSRLSFDTLKALLKAGRITSEIYDHLATLRDIRDSGLEIVQTRLSRDIFHGLVFLDGFPTASLISEGRNNLQVASYIRKRYPTQKDLGDLLTSSDWLKRVKKIYEEFDYREFDPLILAAPTINSEIEYGSLYIKDGCHRSLALALKTNNEGFEYQEVEAIIVFYNRAKYDNLL